MKKEFLTGAKGVTPLLMGAFPMGLSVGIFSVESGFSVFQSMMMSVFIFAGAAQVATVDLLSSHAPFWIVVITAGLINIRFLIYGAAIAPYILKAKLFLRTILSYSLTDMAFIAALDGKNSSRDKSYYLLGAALTIWLTWQISFFLGAFFGAIVPEHWPLSFALPLAFIFFTASRLVSMPNLVAAMVAGGGAVIFIPIIPLQAGLVVSIILGAMAGYLVKKIWMRKTANHE